VYHVGLHWLTRQVIDHVFLISMDCQQIVYILIGIGIILLVIQILVCVLEKFKSIVLFQLTFFVPLSLLLGQSNLLLLQNSLLLGQSKLLIG
jgi:hypothetical protein